MMNAKVADHIQQLINKYPVMVFAKSKCQYSIKAKNILSNYNLGKNYYALDLDIDLDKLLPSSTPDQYLDELSRLTGARTVPRVFIGRKFVGGGNDIEAMNNRGELFISLLNANAIVY